MIKRVLCTWLPDWPIQRLTAARPELNRRPVVLHETRRGTERVMACSAEATALGVAVGMPLAEVAALVEGETTSDFFMPYDPLADRQALQVLAAWCGRFSPLVGFQDSTTPDSLLLDVTGLAHLFDGEGPLAEKVVAEFARRRLAVRVAVAGTVGAAWAVARYGKWKAERGKRKGEVPAALSPLPVEALRLPGETVELLHQLGIYRIGQLEALPRAELSSRFGPRLIERWDQALGRLAEPVPACRPPAELQSEWCPEHPTAQRNTIEAALEALIAQVTQKLVRLGRGAVRLECRLDCISDGLGPLEPVQVSVGVFQPSASAEHLFQLARMQLERLRLPAAVSAMHVAATATAPLPCRQQEMFSDGLRRPRSRDLVGLIDRLSSRLGHRSVVRVRLVSDAQPELAWRGDPLVGDSRRRGLRKTIAAGLPPRPLRLLRRPIALAATSIIPDGPPLRFQLRGREHQVTHTWGPERIETGWWRGRMVGRDYYRIETAGGRRFWLFRRLRDGRWFLQGTFE